MSPRTKKTVSVTRSQRCTWSRATQDMNLATSGSSNCAEGGCESWQTCPGHRKHTKISVFRSLARAVSTTTARQRVAPPFRVATEAGDSPRGSNCTVDALQTSKSTPRDAREVIMHDNPEPSAPPAHRYWPPGRRLDAPDGCRSGVREIHLYPGAEDLPK